MSETRVSSVFRFSGYFWDRHQEKILALAFIAPAVLHLLLFKYIPVVQSFALSLHRGTMMTPYRTFVGMDNYRFLFSSDYFWRAALNTGLYAIGSVPIAAAFALVLALLVSQPKWGRTFFRVAYYTPVVVSSVAAVQIWLYLFNPERYGLLNVILNAAGLPKLMWLYDPNTALMSLILMSFWTVAFNMTIYVAALTNVPEEHYEAALVDGANAWQQFWRITLPSLMPTTFFVVIISSISALKVFEPILLMTGGGPMQSTTMLGYQIYEASFEFNLWGRASAQAVLFFVIVLVITVIQYRYVPESFE